MTTLATATITGHEARGRVELVRGDDGTVTVEIDDLWVSPGAPDVRLYLSPRADGRVDQTAVDLGRLPDHQKRLSRQVPPEVDLDQIRSVIVFCTAFSVYFGTGDLGSPTQSGARTPE